MQRMGIDADTICAHGIEAFGYNFKIALDTIWGEEEGVTPAKIWGFVHFRMAKSHNDMVNFGGIDIKPSIYATVESAVFCNARRELLKSEILHPITTEVGRFTDRQVSK
jgi:hypothetical protein